MDIVQLAALEEEWLKRQRGIIKDREVLYEQLGVYAAWRDIFRQYAALGQDGDLEALKRALFLIWAEKSISRLITGLQDLDQTSIQETLATADQLARESRLDAELEWMLPYYYLVERSYLDRFDNLEALKQASLARPFLYRQRCLDVSFDHRGQMGSYWQAEQTHLRQWP